MDNQNQPAQTPPVVPPSPVNQVTYSSMPNQSSPNQSSPTSSTPGGGWARFWAGFTDSLLVSTVMGVPVIIFLLINKFTNNSLATLRVSWILAILFTELPFIIYKVYYSVNKGATIGKDSYGLQVFKYNTTNRLTYTRSIIREVLNSIPYAVPLLGFLLLIINGCMIVLSKNKRGFHDLLAGSQVVKVNPAWPIKKQGPFFLILILVVALEIAVVWTIDPAIFYGKPLSTSSLPQPSIQSEQPGQQAATNGTNRGVFGFNKQLAEANNTKRTSDTNALLNAVDQYMFDHNGTIPPQIQLTPQEISSTGANICSLITPKNIAALPVDPLQGDASAVTNCSAAYQTGYYIKKDSQGKITVSAPKAELGEQISATR